MNEKGWVLYSNERPSVDKYYLVVCQLKENSQPYLTILEYKKFNNSGTKRKHPFGTFYKILLWCEFPDIPQEINCVRTTRYKLGMNNWPIKFDISIQEAWIDDKKSEA
jgi:hypothetical protein